MSLQAQHVHHGRTKIDTTTAYRLSEVRVTGKTGVAHIRQSGYNAMTIDTKSMQNTTKMLADALRAAPGIKLRETGGVGGQTNIMLDGMDAKYVKVFIDGVPQEGVGSAYRLSNIPVGMADHIEVYKGVVPVEFGTDAMGASSTSSRAAGPSSGMPTRLIPTAPSTPIGRLSDSART